MRLSDYLDAVTAETADDALLQLARREAFDAELRVIETARGRISQQRFRLERQLEILDETIALLTRRIGELEETVSAEEVPECSL